MLRDRSQPRVDQADDELRQRMPSSLDFQGNNENAEGFDYEFKNDQGASVAIGHDQVRLERRERACLKKKRMA
jgi:hypothetical protein